MGRDSGCLRGYGLCVVPGIGRAVGLARERAWSGGVSTCLRGDHVSSYFSKCNNQTENEVLETRWWVWCGFKSHIYQAANEGSNQYESLRKNDLHIRGEKKIHVICFEFRGFVEKNRK